MNIILVIIDTLRYDYIRAHGANDFIQTPNMDRLCADSWVFDNAWLASYPTIPHRTDTLTGKYGSPFHTWQPLPWDWLTFPKLLREAGYATQLIHDTPHLVNGGHNFDWPYSAWTPIRGAEVDRPWIDARSEWPPNWKKDPLFDFVTDKQLAGSHILYCYLRANRKRHRPEDWNTAQLFLKACEFLHDNATRENFMLHIDSFDPHEPWDAPEEFMRMYDKTPGYDGTIDPRSFMHGAIRNAADVPEAALNRVKAAYAAKVSAVDKWVGALLDTLEETGLAKNTAILLTADHGTNVGEYGRFGKKAPVREQEGHIPFIVHVPDGGTGRNDMIVQPQDAFATILGIAGVPMPDGLGSNDVLAVARDGKQEPRAVALSGQSADAWCREDRSGPILFSVFDKQWGLEWAPRPEDCRLRARDALDDVAAKNEGVVERLHQAGLDEIARRGIDPALLQWLRARGESDCPKDACFFDGYPKPKGWHSYWSNYPKRWD